MKINSKWAVFGWLAPVAMTVFFGGACKREQSPAPLGNAAETSTPARTGENNLSTPESRFLVAYREWRQKRIDIDHKPYRNSYYPTYTIGPEFQRIVELGPEAVPFMAKRVEDLHAGGKQYGVSNWCDICLIYGINEIMGWKAEDFFGSNVVGFVNMDEYGRKVVDRVKALKPDELRGKLR
jgi:hypothetical protein